MVNIANSPADHGTPVGCNLFELRSPFPSTSDLIRPLQIAINLSTLAEAGLSHDLPYYQWSH